MFYIWYLVFYFLFCFLIKEEESNFMSDEMKEILGNSEELLKEFANLPSRIEYLKGIISDL